MGMNFAPYERVSGCGDDGRGAANLLYWLDKESPWARTGTNFGVFNCLAGETRVLTRSGWQPIADLAGTDVELLTADVPGRSGRWVTAPVRSFGEQALLRVAVSRDGRERVIHATADHRWFAAADYDGAPVREVVTRDLKLGMKLSSAFPQSVATRTSPSPVGVQAGLVFGDGTKASHDSRIMLCGDKNEALLEWFGERQPRFRHDVGTLVTGLPRSFKDAPRLDEGTSYLYGWLAGYFAADGRVSPAGTVTLYSANPEHLELVRAVALRLGIVTREVIGRKRQGYGDEPSMLYEVGLDGRTLDSDFFLIPEHRERWNGADRRRASRWKVVDVSETDRVEEVFCAVVDGPERFVIDEFILTGNCRNVAGSAKRSKHGRWRAFDLGLPLVNGKAHPIGAAIVRALGEKGRRLGLDELIWDRRYHDERTPDGRYYDGVSPHRDHIHGGLTLAATRNLTVASIRLIMAGITPELTPQQWAQLRVLAAADLVPRVQVLPHMWLNNAPHPLYVVTLRQALNLVLREDLPVDGIYDADQDWQVQRFQHNVESLLGGNPIPENRGTFADHTKVYLVKALTNIRDGRA